MKNELDSKKNAPGDVHALKRRYRILTARMARLGPILQGTITERTIEREDPKSARKKKVYGPYYQWTYKREGKTVTVNLAGNQAKAYQRAIERHRELETLLDEMRATSLALLELSTKGVIKRNRAK